jgi:hypothetical protein
VDFGAVFGRGGGADEGGESGIADAILTDGDACAAGCVALPATAWPDFISWI